MKFSEIIDLYTNTERWFSQPNAKNLYKTTPSIKQRFNKIFK